MHNSKPPKTDFGFQEVPTEDKASLVHTIFQQVAPKYDLMNDLMSGTLHRTWKKIFVSRLPLHPDMAILDLATGTGDIARLFHQKSVQQNLNARITATDVNAFMLQEADARTINAGILADITWQEADAEALPFEDNQFDVCTIAFGLRNVTNKEQALKEALRVLKPGGVFACLEFSHVTHPLLRKAYEAYSFRVIPFIGKLVTQNKSAYQYLVESIQRFPNQETLQHMMQETGFHNVSYENLQQGIVAIHLGWKGHTA